MCVSNTNMLDGRERYVNPQTCPTKEAQVADIQILVAEWGLSREIAMSGRPV